MTQVEVVYSSLRWPPELYRAIKAEATKQGTSVNAYVCEAMTRAIGIKDASMKQRGTK